MSSCASSLAQQSGRFLLNCMKFAEIETDAQHYLAGQYFLLSVAFPIAACKFSVRRDKTARASALVRSKGADRSKCARASVFSSLIPGCDSSCGHLQLKCCGFRPSLTAAGTRVVAPQHVAGVAWLCFVSMVDCREPPPTTSVTHLPSKLYPLLKNFMTVHPNASCTDNCSGHGECHQGICFCEVQYSGGTCTDPNLSYFVAFSTIFYLICAVSFVQLLVCIRSEFSRIKPPSLLKAFKVTTQKALYALICIATFARGFYFSSPENASLEWASSLMSAYYPLLLTGSSLIVCFWAEVFHLRDLRHDKPRFLSKSFLGFLAFNIITYSLLLAELVLTQFAGYGETERSLFLGVFNGSFAVLMVIVVVFFLIYGVEVYFKVRGAFVAGPPTLPNMSQVHQSRLGLVAFATLLLTMVLFIFSDVMGAFWKDKVAVLGRNCHDVMFRVIEMGLALWFPCVLWNCVQPQQLWILNPKKLLVRREPEKVAPTGTESEALFSVPKELAKSGDSLSSLEKLPECFICYDTERTDAGPLIRPCNCKGDVAVVHHDCLRTWLIESAGNSDSNRCKVCNEEYELERGEVWLPSGLSTAHWLQTAAVLVIMGSAVSGACLVVKVFDNVGIRTLAVGLALLVEYVCLRLLGISVLEAYQRAKYSAVRILGRRLSGPSAERIVTATPSARLVVPRTGGHLPADHRAMLTTALVTPQPAAESELVI